MYTGLPMILTNEIGEPILDENGKPQIWVDEAPVEQAPVDVGPLGIPGIASTGDAVPQVQNPNMVDVPVILMDMDTVPEGLKHFIGYYGEESNVVHLVLPDGWNLLDINQIALQTELAQGNYEISADCIGKLDVNPLEQRTCTYFTASATGKEAFNTLDSDFYRFDRNYTKPTCSCPARSGPRRNQLTPCSSVQKMAMCSDYQPTELINEVELHKEGETPIVISSSKFGPGFVGMKVFTDNAVESFVTKLSDTGDVETYTLDEVVESTAEKFGYSSVVQIEEDVQEDEETPGGYFGSIALSSSGV